MAVITLGLSEIKVGEAAPDGTMPTELTKIGKTYQNTCKIAQEASEVTEHYEEGKAAPEVRKKRKKVPQITFSIMDADPQLLADFIGGTVTGVADAAEWGYNGDEVVANKAISVIPEQGLQFDIANADIEAVIDADMSAQGIFLVNFTVTPLAVTAGKAIRAKKKAVV